MAVIAKQRYKLDIAPKGGWVIVYASQHDDGAREIEFEITNQGKTFSIPASINVSVQGIKSNKSYFSHSCSYSGNIVTMALADDMTDVIGKAICVLKFTNSSQQKLATAKFILNVDSDSSSEGIIIDTEAEEIFNQMLNEIRAQAASVSADIVGLQSMVGTPLVASTASAMTNHNKIYVYTGSESGYINGNWYYWNGSAWTSGGVYNSIAVNIDSVPSQGSNNAVSSGGVYEAIPTIDTTLTQAGQAADAKATGDAIAGLEDEIAQIVPGLSSEAKDALLACFAHVAWVDEHGQDYYDALESALYSDTPDIPVISWDYSLGRVPSSTDGITTATTGSKTITFNQNRGVYITGGSGSSENIRFVPTEYSTCKKAYFESVFTITGIEDTGSYTIRLSNGINGVNYNVGMIYVDNVLVFRLIYKTGDSDTMVVIPQFIPEFNTEYKIRIEYEDGGTNKVYINDALIHETQDIATKWTTENRAMAVGGVSVYIKSMKWGIEEEA